jgi:hypothetical protein
MGYAYTVLSDSLKSKYVKEDPRIDGRITLDGSKIGGEVVD